MVETFESSKFIIPHDGYNFSSVFTPNGNIIQHLEDLNSLVFCDDDIAVASYPRSGSHWLYEIVNMLKTGKLEYTTRTIHTYAFDFQTSETLKKRDYKVFGTHYYPRFLPKDFMEKRNKIIYIYRNPKDVVVSLCIFSNKVNIGGITFPMDFVIEEFLKGSDTFCGKWQDHIQEWEQYKQDHPDHPVMIVSYEELKEDLHKAVQKICDFLGMTHPPSFIDSVVEKCQFENMSPYKHEHIPDVTKAMTKDSWQHTNIVFNRGAVGNWKNVLTVSQNERIDTELTDVIKSLKSEVRFTL